MVHLEAGFAKFGVGPAGKKGHPLYWCGGLVRFVSRLYVIFGCISQDKGKLVHDFISRQERAPIILTAALVRVLVFLKNNNHASRENVQKPLYA